MGPRDVTGPKVQLRVRATIIFCVTTHARWKDGSIVVHGEALWEEHACVIAPVELLADVNLASFRDALARVEPIDQRGVVLSPDPRDTFVARSAAIIDGVRLDLEGSRFVVAVRTWESTWDEADARTRIREILAPLLRRHRAEVLRLAPDDWGGGDHLEALIAIPVRGRTVGEAIQLGCDARALLNALRGGSLAPDRVIDLVEGGHADALVDRPETQWLEAKSAPYRLDEDSEKLELAKDVAALANASGGVILLGAHVRRQAGGDVIDRFSPIPLEMVQERRYRAVLGSRVIPAIEDLRFVRAHRGDGRGAAALFIPPQRETLKPFLVRGAMVNGRPNASYVSVPVRTGEDIRFEDAAALQGQLAAGRAALRAERAAAAMRDQMTRLTAETRRGLDRLAGPEPPVLIAGEGSGSGAFRMKPDGCFIAWVLNVGGQPAQIDDALLTLGPATGEAEYPDGRRLSPNEQKAIFFLQLRDQAPVTDLERCEGSLAVLYRPLKGGDTETLQITLRPSPRGQRMWDVAERPLDS
jgi:hypothetical protein